MFGIKLESPPQFAHRLAIPVLQKQRPPQAGVQVGILRLADEGGAVVFFCHTEILFHVGGHREVMMRVGMAGIQHQQPAIGVKCSGVVSRLFGPLGLGFHCLDAGGQIGPIGNLGRRGNRSAACLRNGCGVRTARQQAYGDAQGAAQHAFHMWRQWQRGERGNRPPSERDGIDAGRRGAVNGGE